MSGSEIHEGDSLSSLLYDLIHATREESRLAQCYLFSAAFCWPTFIPPLVYFNLAVARYFLHFTLTTKMKCQDMKY